MCFHFVTALWACFADFRTLGDVRLSLTEYLFEVCGGGGTKIFEIRN